MKQTITKNDLQEFGEYALNPFAWKEFCSDILPDQKIFKTTQVIEGDLVAARWGTWGVNIEQYHGDKEPHSKDLHAPARMVVWHRFFDNRIPPGWRKLGTIGGILHIGYAVLVPTYYTNWNKTARNNRARWHRDSKGKLYIITSITREEYEHVFRNSKAGTEVFSHEMRRLDTRISRYPHLTKIWGVKRISDGRVVAVINVYDNKLRNATHYGCGGFLPEVQKENLMVALIDHWFADAVERGVRIAHMGVFTGPDDDVEERLKSISYFKGQFITHLHAYQSPLWRFARGVFPEM